MGIPHSISIPIGTSCKVFKSQSTSRIDTDEENKKWQEDVARYKEQENKRKEQHKEYLIKNYEAYDTYKQIQRKIMINDKGFKINLPINLIHDVKVETYLNFTFLEKCNYTNRMYFKIHLYIYSKDNENNLYYMQKISNTEVINYNETFEDIETIRIDDIIKIKSLLHYVKDILTRIELDTYNECFVTYSLSNKEKNFTSVFSDISNVKLDVIYTCNICDGETKRTNNKCYFCSLKITNESSSTENKINEIQLSTIPYKIHLLQ